MKSLASILALTVCAAGCASTPVPKARLASTTTAVQSAQNANADSIPAAAPHLATAEGELAKAKKEIAAGKNEQAATLLKRAEPDATLAASLAREAHQKAATDGAKARVQSLSTSTEPSGR